MGQIITKLYTVSLDTPSDPSHNIFSSIQEAIDAADSGTTIVLNGGDHSGPNYGSIIIKSGLRFIGLNRARIVSPIESTAREESDIIFESVIFKNKNNATLTFANTKGFLFRNCEFQIDIKGIPIGGYNPRVRFGFQLSNSSALLQNPIFCINVEEIEVFIAIGADDNSSYLSLQSPIIRICYKNICKLETYFYRGVSKASTIPYFEAFSSSIHYKTEMVRSHKYDGHCCIKEKDHRKCSKRHCENDCSSRCKSSHHCCEKKCKRNKVIPLNVRLFRGLDCVNATLTGTKAYFIEGKGAFNIAGGDSPIYINGLTVSTTVPKEWEIGDFNNILLTSFMSNMKSACDIKEYHCIDKCDKCTYGKDADCDDSVPCDQPSYPTQPCDQQPCGQQPYGQQPCGKQQCGQQPCSPQPCGQQPYSQQPCASCSSCVATVPNIGTPFIIPGICTDTQPCGMNPCPHKHRSSKNSKNKFKDVSESEDNSAYFY